MSNSRCEICRGQGQIRLPIYRSVSVYTPSDELVAPTAQEAYKIYPCPECAETIPVERLGIIDYHSEVGPQDPRLACDQEYMRYACDNAAHHLFDEIIKGGFIQYERGPTDDRRMSFPLRATMGVASLKTVATFKERVRQHQEMIAREVMVEAADQISNWGSYYGHADILKSQARDCIQAALTTVLARHSNRSQK